MAKNRHTVEYMKVKVNTAAPTELLIMLFDGAIRFTKQAITYIEKNELYKKNERLVRAQNIMLELIQALDKNLDPKIYNNLVGLYKFCYDRLPAANTENRKTSAEEALKILGELRETWQLAIEKSEEEDGKIPKQTSEHICIKG